jgi:hypothetical protein
LKFLYIRSPTQPRWFSLLVKFGNAHPHNFEPQGSLAGNIRACLSASRWRLPTRCQWPAGKSRLLIRWFRQKGSALSALLVSGVLVTYLVCHGYRRRTRCAGSTF